jgi:hypothetical protein
MQKTYTIFCQKPKVAYWDWINNLDRIEEYNVDLLQ